MIYKKLLSVCIRLGYVSLSCLVLFSCTTNDERNEGSAYVEERQYVPVRNYYPKEYHPYVQPYSRQYTNPYAYPPRNYYPYYDSDQYYVPPSSYYGYEQDNSYRSGSDQGVEASSGKY